MLPMSDMEMVASRRSERGIDSALKKVYMSADYPRESARRDKVRQLEKKSTAEIPCRSCILFKTCEKRRRHGLAKCKYGVRDTENTACKIKTHLI